MNKCDVCGHIGPDVKPGRWVFYCSNPACKQVDLDKTFDNEIAGVDLATLDGELSEAVEKILA